MKEKKSCKIQKVKINNVKENKKVVATFDELNHQSN
jgi:hypothetical protein